MAYDLKDRVALITGAGGGIGSAITRRLIGYGVKPVLVGRSLEKLERCVGGQDCDALLLAGDLRDAGFAADAVRRAAEKYGRLDILINNAGVAQNQAFEEITLEDYDRIMDTNVKAPFILCREALPYLKKTQGTILNIASVTAHKGYVQQSVYSAAKHALLGMSKSLAREVYREGVRVHVISPGGVYTDMVTIARPDLTSDGMITADEIADVAEFLLTHRGNAVIDEVCVHRAGKEPFQ